MPQRPNRVVSAEGAGRPEGLDEASGPFQPKTTTLEVPLAQAEFFIKTVSSLLAGQKTAQQFCPRYLLYLGALNTLGLTNLSL